MIHVITRKRLAPGMAAKVKAMADDDRGWLDLGHRDLCEHKADIQNYKWLYDPAKDVFQYCGWIRGVGEGLSLASFMRVGRHNDDWADIWIGKKLCAPAFLHHVLHGQATIRVGRKTVKVRKGDVFVMDMNVNHEVISRSLCCTALVTVARKDYRTLAKARESLGMAA